MGQYCAGDVLLAPVALNSHMPVKARPVVVLCAGPDGMIRACPVSSRPPTDAPSVPITINDFTSGGLDLFSESYVMTSRIIMLRSGQVIGKKGRVTDEYLEELEGRTRHSPSSAIQPSRKRAARNQR